MTFVEEENERTIDARRKLSVDEADEERRATFSKKLQKQTISKTAFMSIFNKGMKNLDDPSPPGPAPNARQVTEVNLGNEEEEDSTVTVEDETKEKEEPTEERNKARTMRSPDRDLAGPQVTITDQEITPKIKTSRRPELELGVSLDSKTEFPVPMRTQA